MTLRLLYLLMERFQTWIKTINEPKDEFGLTHTQASELILDARNSVRGYDRAMELAISGYGLTFEQFDRLMAQSGIARR